MRLRDQTLRTGSLLAWFDPSDRRRNAGLLFLVAGARDIPALREAERACQPWLNRDCCWLTVADQLDLAGVDPDINPGNLSIIEAAELANLRSEDVARTLRPAVWALRAGQRPVFPAAGGAVGAVAEGVDFLDREPDLAALGKLLTEGRSVLLVAPRRSGKTSLLRRLAGEVAGTFRVVSIDLEGSGGPESAATRCLQAVKQQPFMVARRQVTQMGWSEALPQALTFPPGGPRPALLIDELVLFLEDLKTVAERLQFLQVLGAALSAAGAVAIVAGSRDLEDFAREEMGLTRDRLPPPFHALTRYPLPPLAEDCLGAELRRVLIGSGLVAEDGDTQWLKDNLDLAMPFPALRFLVHLGGEVRARGPQGPREMDQVLGSFLDHTDSFAEHERCLEKLGRKRAAAETAAEEALTWIAREKDGVEIAAVAGRLRAGGGDEQMAWLLEHFPLREQDGRVVMASRLFCRWWLRRAGEPA